MTRTRGGLLVVSGLLLLAWLTGGGQMPVSRAAAPRPVPPPLEMDPAVTDLVRQTARLQAHLSAPRSLPPLQRNLFAFAGAGSAASRPARRGPVLEAGLALPARPAMRVIGVAEDDGDGGRVRTAVISALEQLFFVHPGDRVLGRYEVVRVGEDAVELKDGETTFTLTMK